MLEECAHEHVLPGRRLYRFAPPAMFSSIKEPVSTNVGTFRHIAPTGRAVTVQEMVFWRGVDGQLQTGWLQADMLGIRIQLGALPLM